MSAVNNQTDVSTTKNRVIHSAILRLIPTIAAVFLGFPIISCMFATGSGKFRIEPRFLSSMFALLIACFAAAAVATVLTSRSSQLTAYLSHSGPRGATIAGLAVKYIAYFIVSLYPIIMLVSIVVDSFVPIQAFEIHLMAMLIAPLVGPVAFTISFLPVAKRYRRP
jgi:hypothetical protein